MGSFGALFITLSCLSPSIGVFIVASDVMRQAGTAVFICFLAAVLLGVAMAAVYAELSSAFPHTGGEYTIVGRVIGAPAGFAMLGVNLFGFSIAQAISGLGTVDYLRAVAPGLAPVPTAIALVVTVTLIGVLNVRLNALVTGIFLAVELLALAVTALLGLAHPHRGAGLLAQPVMAAHGGLQPVPLVLIGVAAAGAIYAFNGYGAVVFFGEEIREARRKVGRVVYWALGLAALAELTPLLAILIGAPDLKNLLASPSPVAAFVREAGGPALGTVMSLAVALAIFNAMIAVALVGGRQLYATARDRCWPEPANRWFERVHPRFGSPWIATLAIGLTSILWCFAPLRLLVTIIANGNVATYSALCVAALIGRRTGATSHSRSPMPLFPLPPILALAALAGVVWADLMDPETGRPGLAAMAAILFGSALYSLLVRRRGSAWAHRGPADELA